MSDVEEKLAKSLTAESKELIPYLPYLLQDLWELGSSPKDMIDMIRRHVRSTERMKVLDLACGKGAVGVQMAKALGCRVKGIDIMPGFIGFARRKAREYGVENLCEFVVGDINEAVEIEKDHDIVLLGAAGDVLGTIEQTIRMLKGTVKERGYILIDDAYGNSMAEGRYPAREAWLSEFRKAGLLLLEERFNEDEELERLNEEQQSFIRRRADELKGMHPDEAGLFERYVKSQQAECEELENDISGVALLLQVAG